MAFPAETAELLERVRKALPAGQPVYLVGGAVRDLLLGRATHDLDFALSGDVLRLSRQAGNALKAAYYPLDERRDTARLVLTAPDGQRTFLDFAALRGPDLEADLRGRDFTINAIAIELGGELKLIDPLGGAADLRLKQLRACAPDSFQADPLRILRAVRLAAGLRLFITPETRQWLRQAVPRLGRVSPERVRDELFRMLEGPQPAAALRSLDVFGALGAVLPELEALKGVTQSPPHVLDVWAHSLEAVQRLQAVFNVLAPEPDPKLASSFALGLISMRLGRYRQELHAHLETRLNPERSLRGLLLFAALYHDIGKPAARQVEAGGRIRFLDHDQQGAKLAGERLRRLKLSADEVERVETILRNHMRPLLLAQSKEPPSRRAIYRFFRAGGPAGVDVCLLAMADTLATYGTTLPADTWQQFLDVERALLEAWWERAAELVSPPALVNGNDLMQSLGLKPGPQIGELLERIREAQAGGQIGQREEALALAKSIVAGKAGNQG